jgi:hypothetical protein
MGESVRNRASLAAVELLYHLRVITLISTSDLTFGVLLYLVFQFTMIAGHYAVIYTQKFGPGRPVM